MPDQSGPSGTPPVNGILAGRDILLLESNALIAMDVADILHDHGASRVRIASHPAQAAEFLNGPRPDLAILSLPEKRMPVLEFARSVMAMHVPCVFFSTDSEVLRGDVEFSAVPVLNKPVSADALVAALRILF